MSSAMHIAAVLLVLFAGSTYAFQIPSSTRQRHIIWTRRREPHVMVKSLSVSASNATEASVREEGGREDRIVKVGDSARNADDDDKDFERVKDAKFVERNKRWIVLIDDEESIRLAVGDYLYSSGKLYSAQKALVR